MKKTMCTLVAVGTALLTTRAAQAETGSNWSGTEVLVSAQTEVSVFRASVAYFGVPKAGTDILFSYFGPKLRFGEWGWISPQLGVAANWKNQTDFLDASLWGSASYKSLSLFLEGDYLMASGQKADIYSYGSLDFNWDSYNVGAHIEGVNRIFGYGPQIGVSKAVQEWSWHGEVQYYLRPVEGQFSHTVRFVSGLSF